MRFGLLLMTILSLLPCSLGAQQVTSMALCDTVQDNEPVGVKQVFAVRDRAYCWIQVEDATPGDRLQVRWYFEDSLHHVETLPLPAPSWRTHCYKTLYSAGQWRMVLRNQQGDSLAGQSLVAADALAEHGQTRGTPDPPRPSPGMPQPAPLQVPEGFAASLASEATLHLPPNYSTDRPHPLLVIFPTVGQPAPTWLAQWADVSSAEVPQAFWSVLFPVDRPALPPVVLMLPESLQPRDRSWSGFSAAIYRYENRLFADLQRLRQQHPLLTERVLLVGQGLGGDLAWAIAQRYPDRVHGAALFDCRCSYYQRGSLAIQAHLGVRYLLAHGPITDPETEANLRQSRKLLMEARVPFQQWELPQPAPEGLDLTRLQQGFDFLLPEATVTDQ